MNYFIKSADKNINITVREPIDSDFEQYTDFIKKIAKESKFTYHYVGEPDIDRKKQLDLWHSPYRYTLIAFDDNKMIGYFCLYVTNPEHPYLKHNGGTHTYILKDYTGYGLGTFFLDQIEKRIHLLGIKRVSCNVHSNNTKNLKSLQNQGFIIESVAKNRYFIDGKYIDGCNLVKWYD